MGALGPLFASSTPLPNCIPISDGSSSLNAWVTSGSSLGTVTSVSMGSANGFTGNVTDPTTTPFIEIGTSVTGILYGDGTGVAAAIAANFPTLNQNTTGSAATLTTPRSIYGASFNGSADLAGPVTVPFGGTGLATLTANNVILGNGTSTPNFVAPGTSGNVLTSNGTTWTSAAPSGGGTPGGSTTQLQYNNAGAFGGISGATTDGTNTTFGSANLRATSPRITTSILDLNGNTILTLAGGSSNNAFSISNGGVGVAPILSALGADADVGITIKPKAAGVVRIFSDSLYSSILRIDTATSGSNEAPWIYLAKGGTLRGLITSAGGAGQGVAGSSDNDLVVRSQGTNIDFTTDSGTTLHAQFVASTGQLYLQQNIASSSTTTGSLRVTGGVGVSGAVFIGGNASVAGTLSATSPRFTTDVSDANGNEVFRITATASAVNEITFVNAASGSSPQINASGGGADVGIIFNTKGTGQFSFIVPGGSTNQFNLDTVSGTGSVYHAYKLAGASQCFVGTPGSAGAIIVGSAVGDLLLRANATNIDFSTDSGASIAMKVIATTGLIQMAKYGAGTATFDASGNISSVSDMRVKRDIRAFNRGLKEIMALKPVLHGYTKASQLDQTKNDYAGFLAQDVRSVIPEAIGMNADGMLSFADRPLVAALVNAVKELKAEIETLKNAA